VSDVFPIDPLLPEILASLERHPRLVLEAPPGAGKTTRVPPALLAAPWLQGCKVLMLEPRRIAARAAANFMASERGEQPGETVGYRIRFESKVGPRTRIEVVTEGILTRLIQDDPGLDGIGALLFDEFHERHLSADLGLALALEVQAQLRPDLRIVVMSATLDGERLAKTLDAPRLSSAGRSFPVRIAYPPRAGNETEDAQLKRAVELALRETDGDLLVFLPGLREIQRGERLLFDSAQAANADLLPLYGELPVEQQAAVLKPSSDGRRRIMSVAELTGMEGQVVQMQEIYKYIRKHVDPDGTIHGEFRATGIRPKFMEDMKTRGIDMPPQYFDPDRPLGQGGIRAAR